MAETSIEWTERSWNPIAGCSLVSPGCTNCYAMGIADRFKSAYVGRKWAGAPAEAMTRRVNGKAVWTGQLLLAPDRVLAEPLRRRKPTTYFVNSMGDLFHEDMPDEWIDIVFAIMALCPQHTFQILTKRAARMRAYLEGLDRDELDDKDQRLTGAVNAVMRIAATDWGRCGSTATHITTRLSRSGAMEAQMLRSTSDGCVERLVEWTAEGERWFRCGQPFADRIHAAWGSMPYPRDFGWGLKQWPLPNVWLGVSAEDQKRADERIPELLATPAAVRFVSAEPLLGPIAFREISPNGIQSIDALSGLSRTPDCDFRAKLDWIIVGGESGAGARPMHPDWPRQIRNQCVAAGTAFFFKQWGEWQPREWCRDGGTHALNRYPGHSFQRIQSHPDSIERVGAGPDWAALAKVGKKAAGRFLDGVEHNAMPEGRR